jgi:hypothetical protein
VPKTTEEKLSAYVHAQGCNKSDSASEQICRFKRLKLVPFKPDPFVDSDIEIPVNPPETPGNTVE